MTLKPENIKSVPTTVPTKTIFIKAVVPNYSEVKLYIPKITKNGKKIPTAGPGKYWHVYFYFRNPETGKFDSNSKFTYRDGINKHFKTVKDRKAYGKNLVRAYTMLLEDGFNPYKNTIPSGPLEIDKIMLLEEAMKYALNNKKKEIGTSTYTDWKHRLKRFLTFTRAARINELEASKITSRHISAFLNSLELSNKSVNNYKSCLSALFSKLVDDGVISKNPVIDIKKRKENPEKNKPFTAEEIAAIKNYCLENNLLGLLLHLRLVAYSFLRPIEVIRITLNDIDLINATIAVKTKTEARAYVRILKNTKLQLEELKLNSYRSDYFLLGRKNEPSSWYNEKKDIIVNEKSRAKIYSDQFNQVKKHFGFDNNYSVYSLRHSFALNLYQHYLSEGLSDIEAQLKMLPITRHKSLAGLRNYLRGIGAFTPGDYSKSITIEL